jgi:soluble lytic murein transglycosylase-like protein
MPSQVNDDYDALFDGWGRALNVDPQLGKTVFWLESTHNPSIKNGDSGEQGGMQMLPETAARMATKLGLDPKSIDLHDMRWAVPLAMQYLAEGVNATKSGEGALGYYNSGTADPQKWTDRTRSYIEEGVKSYPNMGLKLPPSAAPVPAPPVAPTAADIPPAPGTP